MRYMERKIHMYELHTHGFSMIYKFIMYINIKNEGNFSEVVIKQRKDSIGRFLRDRKCIGWSASFE